MRNCLDCEVDISDMHGRTKRCEACAVIRKRILDRESSRKWRTGNPEKAQESNRKWVAANSEKRGEYGRKWRAANPEKVRKWRAANLEKAQESDRKWSAANLEKRRGYQRRRRELCKGGIRKHLETLIREQDGLCGICDQPLPAELSPDIHVDHIIPVSKGGTDIYSNFQAAHASCNFSKGNRIGDS